MGCGASLESETPREQRPIERRSHHADRSQSRATSKQWGKGISRPVVPSKKKDEVFDANNFFDLDFFASKEMVPMNILQGSYEDLAVYLTKKATNELQKVRVTFMWLTSINLQNLVHEAGHDLPPEGSPMEGLLEIHWGMGNHAHFYAKLARIAGIECEIVSGVNKNANYQTGQPIDEDLLAGQWNAVNIDGNTYLIDVYWASTCVDDTTAADWLHLWNLFEEPKRHRDSIDQSVENQLKTKHRINEFFFLTDPDKLIKTHYPEEPKWQLLKNHISLDEFSKQVCVRERFYEMGLKLGNDGPSSCFLSTNQGQVTFKLLAPKDTIAMMRFRWKFAKVDVKPNEPASSFDRYVYYQKKGQEVEFWIVVPVEGRFQFDLYGQIGSGEHYDKVASFHVQCDCPPKTSEPLPDLPDAGWGLLPNAEEHQLVPKFEADPFINTDTGELDLEFQAPECKVLGYTLRSNTIDDIVLRRHALVTRKDRKVIVKLRFPSKGSFALGIYIGNDSEKEMFNVANYMIHCSSTGITSRPFPMFTNGCLGEDLMADVIGVRADNMNNVIETDDGHLQLNFKVKNYNAVDLLCEVEHNDMDSTKLGACVTSTGEGNYTTLDIQLPSQGEYGINVFARKMGVDYQIFQIFSYMVIANSGSGSVIRPSDEEIAMDGIFTADDIVDIRVAQSKGAMLAVLKKNAQNYFVDNQITAKKEGDMTVYEVDLPTTGEYVAVVYRMKGCSLSAKQIFQIVRLEPLQGDTRSMAMMFPDRRLNKLERKKRKSMALGLNHESFRLQLRAAVASQNVSLLQWAISQCEMNYVPERNGEILKSKRILDYLLVNQEITHAMQARNLNRLRLAMNTANSKGLNKVLQLKLAMAQRIVDTLAQFEKIREAIENTDRRQVLRDLEALDPPPEIALTIIVATCDLLGLDGNQIQDWETVRAILMQKGKNSLKKMMLRCNLSRVDIVAVMRTKRSLGQMEQADVEKTTQSMALLYKWCMAVVDEVESRFVSSGGDLRQANNLAQRSEFKKIRVGSRLSAENPGERPLNAINEEDKRILANEIEAS